MTFKCTRWLGNANPATLGHVEPQIEGAEIAQNWQIFMLRKGCDRIDHRRAHRFAFGVLLNHGVLAVRRLIRTRSLPDDCDVADEGSAVGRGARATRGSYCEHATAAALRTVALCAAVLVFSHKPRLSQLGTRQALSRASSGAANPVYATTLVSGGLKNLF